MQTRRRRSPQWVRDLDQRSLHGLAGRFQRKYFDDDLSSREEWLWGRVISELEWRFTHRSDEWLFCSCEMCFVDVDIDVAPVCQHELFDTTTAPCHATNPDPF